MFVSAFMFIFISLSVMDLRLLCKQAWVSVARFCRRSRDQQVLLNRPLVLHTRV